MCLGSEVPTPPNPPISCSSITSTGSAAGPKKGAPVPGDTFVRVARVHLAARARQMADIRSAMSDNATRLKAARDGLVSPGTLALAGVSLRKGRSHSHDGTHRHSHPLVLVCSHPMARTARAVSPPAPAQARVERQVASGSTTEEHAERQRKLISDLQRRLRELAKSAREAVSGAREVASSLESAASALSGSPDGASELRREAAAVRGHVSDLQGEADTLSHAAEEAIAGRGTLEAIGEAANRRVGQPGASGGRNTPRCRACDGEGLFG